MNESIPPSQGLTAEYAYTYILLSVMNSMDKDADSKTRKIIENILTLGKLPVNSTDKGYCNWKKEADEKIRRISSFAGDSPLNPHL